MEMKWLDCQVCFRIRLSKLSMLVALYSRDNCEFVFLYIKRLDAQV